MESGFLEVLGRIEGGKKSNQVETVGHGVGSDLATDLKRSEEGEAQNKGKPWDLISSLGRNLARKPLLDVCRGEKASHGPGAQMKIHFLTLLTFDS